MIDPEKVYHVYPRNDLEEHYLECVYPAIGHPYCPCKCKPTFQEEPDGALLIIHNSYDGREGLEAAEEIINPKIKGEPCVGVYMIDNKEVSLDFKAIPTEVNKPFVIPLN